MTPYGQKLEKKLMSNLRRTVYKAMLSGFKSLQNRTNKDTGMAASGWVMSVGDSEVDYCPEKHKDASRVSRQGMQDDRYVALQEEHLASAKALGDVAHQHDVFKITNNVPHMIYINTKWNPGFFEQVVDGIRMNLEDVKDVELEATSTTTTIFEDEE